jgi:Do/DeqQ family serine protease
MIRHALLVIACLGAGPALAGGSPARVLPASVEQIQLSFAPVVRKAAPAVVNIYSRRAGDAAATPSADSSELPSNGEMMPDDAGPPNSLGSGVIVDPDGTIVTNWHVIRDAGAITVVLSDRREFDATIVRTDERADLAVLRIRTDGLPLPYLELRDSDELEVGDLVLAIGNPFGVGQTVTNGIVSALARTVPGISDYRTYIQTDAAINPGNSGGALVSLDGRLVGINTALYSEGNGSVGIGFAIPTALVRSVLDSSATGGSVVRPWFGAQGRTVGAYQARRLGLPRPEGVLIQVVVPESPTADAGLEPGDVVLSVDGKSVEDADELHYRFATLPLGTRARLGLWRAGRAVQVSVRLIAPPEVPPREVTQLPDGTALAGLTIANLSPALADELENNTIRGIIVLDIERGMPAARLHLAVGDIIEAIDGMPVATVDALRRTVASLKPPLRLEVQRKERRLTLAAGD